MDRRRFLASAGAGAATASAGCLDALLSDPTTHESTPATVSEAALADAGYDHRETRTRVDEESVAGETVEVTSHVAAYVRTIEVPGYGDLEAAAFAAVATPAVTIAGEEFNPVGGEDREGALDVVREEYEGHLAGDFSVGDSVGAREVEALERTVTVETFAGQVRPASIDVSLDVGVDVARFDHGDDHLVLVGVYPAGLPSVASVLSGSVDLDDEDDRVTTMIEGLEHGE